MPHARNFAGCAEAFHLYGGDRFANNDWVYPTLARDVMPEVFVGFFAAVMFGTVFTTYNSVLNSVVTLYAIDLCRPAGVAIFRMRHSSATAAA